MPFPRLPIDYGASGCIVNCLPVGSRAQTPPVRYSGDGTMMQRREPERFGTSRIALGGEEAKTPHERYEEALAAHREAESRVQALAGSLSGLGRALTENPLTVAPVHEASGESLPLHITTHPFRTQVNMGDWPEARSIIEALGQLHRARSRALALRSWMLPEDRDAAPAP